MDDLERQEETGSKFCGVCSGREVETREKKAGEAPPLLFFLGAGSPRFCKSFFF